MLVAINGFHKTGIWPVKSDVFGDEDFLAADTTDLPLPIEAVQSPQYDSPSTSQQIILPTASPSHTSSATPTSTNATHENQQVNSPLTAMFPTNFQATATQDLSSLMDIQRTETPPPGPFSSFHVVSPANIMYIPKAQQQKRTKRQRGKTAIITNSPYKKELEEKVQKKPEVKKGKKILKKTKTTKIRKKMSLKKMTSSASIAVTGTLNLQKVGYHAEPVIGGLIVPVQGKTTMMTNPLIFAHFVLDFRS